MDGVMRQTLMTFASTAARDSALSGVLANGMHTYQTDTNTITMYNGSAWRIVHRGETGFTPTWSNVTLGSATNGAWYTRSGDKVFVDFGLSWGAGTAFTGSPSFALPVPMDTTSFAVGSGVAHDVGTARHPLAMLVDPGGGQSVTPIYASGTGLLSATTPFTWVSGDILIGSFSYTAA
jgi:hypothetical protein